MAMAMDAPAAPPPKAAGDKETGGKFRPRRMTGDGPSDVSTFIQLGLQLREKQVKNLCPPLLLANLINVCPQVLSNATYDAILEELCGSESSKGRFATEFKYLATLGKGADGTVFLCANLFDKNEYALKKILLRGNPSEDVMKEALTLARIDHPNIVKYFSSWIEKESVYIQMEYCHSTLKEVLDKHLPVPPLTFKQLVDAVAYLHNHRIIHRDIAPKNIFYDRYNNLKLGDFGLAKRKSSSGSSSVASTTTGKVGTGLYSSPQQLENDLASDIFSLGMILFEIHYKFQDERERVQILTLVKNARLDEVPGSWEVNHPQLASVVKQLTHPVRAMRPRADEIPEMLSDLAEL